MATTKNVRRSPGSRAPMARRPRETMPPSPPAHVGGPRYKGRFDAFAQEIAALRFPRYEEIPQIDLYMDQLIGYIDELLAPIRPKGEKRLTASMVNNYVKQGLVPQPRAKRYSREHIAYLTGVVILKRTLSLAEIDNLLTVSSEAFPTGHTYDFFITVFEESLRALFCGKLSGLAVHDCTFELPDKWGAAIVVRRAGGEPLNAAHRLAISAATCAANGLYLAKTQEFANPGEDD